MVRRYSRTCPHCGKNGFKGKRGLGVHIAHRHRNKCNTAIERLKNNNKIKCIMVIDDSAALRDCYAMGKEIKKLYPDIVIDVYFKE